MRSSLLYAFSLCFGGPHPNPCRLQNRPKKLNSLGPPAWRRLAELIKEAEALPNTFVTIVTGVGSFFSAGADVSADYGGVPGESAVVSAAKSFAGLNMLTAEAISKHPKITVAALNGPAIGQFFSPAKSVLFANWVLIPGSEGIAAGAFYGNHIWVLH